MSTIDLDRLQTLVRASDDERAAALLDELQPFDIAALLGREDEPVQLRLLGLLPPERAAQALEHLDYQDQYRLLDHAPPRVSAAVLQAMSSEALSDLIGAVHPARAHELLARLPEDRRGEVRRLLEYPEGTVGARMSLNYLEAFQHWTADQVLAHFRKVGRTAKLVNYVYVVDETGRLVGVTSLREVLLSDPGTPVAEIMYTQVVSVSADADQESAARLFEQYDFVALPVVDRAGRIVGIITADDILDIVVEEATEDIQILGGTRPLATPYLEAGLLWLFRRRIGWLLLLFLAASFTTSILRHHAAVLDEVVALAFFIPLLIGTGGNSGGQTATLVVRAMALGEVTLGDFARVVWREAQVGLILGAAMAAAAYALAGLLGQPALIGVTVAATIVLIVVVGSVLGATFPLVGRRLGVDPAVFSAPMITTILDAAGLLIYFQVARLVLGLP